MMMVMFYPGKWVSVTRILDGESEVDNVILCLKRCLILFVSVNAEECWQNLFFTLLTLYLIWYKWLWKQFSNWNLSFPSSGIQWRSHPYDFVPLKNMLHGCHFAYELRPRTWCIHGFTHTEGNTSCRCHQEALELKEQLYRKPRGWLLKIIV